MRWVGSMATAGTEDAVMGIPLVESGRDSASRGMVVGPSSLPAEAVTPAGSPTLCVSAINSAPVEVYRGTGLGRSPADTHCGAEPAPNIPAKHEWVLPQARGGAQKHRLWEMGGSGVQHLGTGASPGGVLTASRFGDLTQQFVEKHSWLLYEGGLKFSRLLQKQVHTHALLLGWTPSSHVRSTFLLR